jgi:hypothetical protein
MRDLARLVDKTPTKNKNRNAYADLKAGLAKNQANFYAKASCALT